MSENPFSDVEFNIIENPRNDKELALNLIREYFIKIQNNINSDFFVLPNSFKNNNDKKIRFIQLICKNYV
mgnify:CR=1 FL=1